MKALFIFVSDLVLFLSLATLVFAVGACLTMMLRRRTPQRKRRELNEDGLPLLRRYVPPD